MLQSDAHMLPFSKLAQLQAEKGGPCLRATASSCEALSLPREQGWRRPAELASPGYASKIQQDFFTEVDTRPSPSDAHS